MIPPSPLTAVCIICSYTCSAIQFQGGVATEATCLEKAKAEFGDKVIATRTTLISGSWSHVPAGCSVQSGGDWAAHWNSRS